jgi:lysophospholipid acyltransferase (LPLAT)-like uncharacterized protein
MDVNSFRFKIFLKFIKWIVSSYRFNAYGMERVLELAKDNTLVFATMHGQMTGVMHILKHYENIVSMASKSKDGDIAEAVFKYLGVNKIVRGSSSRRGKEALIELIKNIDKKSTVCMTVDGPKGPRLKVKPGVIYIAKQTDKIIIPIVYSCKYYIQFKSWDKFMLPYPYSKLNVFYGSPFYVSDNTDKETIEKERLELEKMIEELVIAHCPNML